MQKIKEPPVIAGGVEIDGAFAPTIMKNVTDNMNIICEEVFAPIVSLIKVSSYDEAHSSK